MNHLMTVSDIAKLLKLSESFVYKLVENEKIPYIKINKNVRFLKEQIEQFLSINTKNPILES